MKFTNDDIELSIEVDAKLMTKLANTAKKKLPNEYGGILIGKYSSDQKTVLIEDTILPKKYTSSAVSFNRGIEGLKDQLTKHFTSEANLIYVGEWHTHPNGRPIPSGTDRIAMAEIARHDQVFIKNPILLIIGLTKTKADFKFYVFYKQTLYDYKEKT